MNSDSINTYSSPTFEGPQESAILFDPNSRLLTVIQEDDGE
jgi:hypothetical protein